MSAREGRSNCGGIEGISNDIKEIGLTIMEFRTLEISAERPRDGIGGLHEEIEGSVDSV